MSEKEFLKAFKMFELRTLYNDCSRTGGILTETDICINNFLEEQHKEYYEVEFIKKEEMDKFYKQMDNELREEQEAKEGIKGWDI